MSEIDLSGIRRVAKHIAETPKKADKAMQRARGTLRRRVGPEARRDIQKEYALRAGRITQGLRASNVPDGVELTGSSRGIGLMEFNARQTPEGVVARVRKDRPPRTVAGAFIAPMLSGNQQAMKRHGAPRRMTKGRYAGKMRQPLQTQYGPSVAQMLRAPGRAEHLADFAHDILSAEIARLLS